MNRTRTLIPAPDGYGYIAATPAPSRTRTLAVRTLFALAGTLIVLTLTPGTAHTTTIGESGNINPTVVLDATQVTDGGTTPLTLGDEPDCEEC